MDDFQYEVSISFGVTADSFVEAGRKFIRQIVLGDWFIEVRHIESDEKRILDTKGLQESDE